MDILEKIVAGKMARIRKQGHTLGCIIPDKRDLPLVAFMQEPLLICEIKRKSPSRGNIAAGLKAGEQAALYRQQGVRSVSILTEQDHFAGSLDDLREVKTRFPDLAVLRKDFLLFPEDIEVSYRAGADAVLLIASILDEDTLALLYARTRELGMQALVEVHTAEDIAKAQRIRSELTGINCRDLHRFTTDLTLPLQVKRRIDWPTKLVFESGIHSAEDARFALGSGFHGLLVGEAVVREPALIGSLQAVFSAPRLRFWEKLYSRPAPYVKICGITNREDAEHAAACGADILGFIFATSKHRAAPELLPCLKHLDILKVAVVVTDEFDPPALMPEVKQLLAEGLLDALQFHGDESPETCAALAFPYYKALRLGSAEEIERIGSYHCPRVLVDAYHPESRGGTGRRIPEKLVHLVRAQYPLWMAGGVGPHNICEVLEQFSPELIDAASKLEAAPGCKDPVKVAAFIREIKSRC